MKTTRSTLTWSRWRRVRQTVQALAFALYIYLLFAALPGRSAFALADVFFRLDPLVGVSAMLAARAWIPRLALALLVVGLTLTVGRAWCGWLCPFGTLLEWLRFSRTQSPSTSSVTRAGPGQLTRWRVVKNSLLLLILAAAVLGNLSLLVFDPLTLFTRAMTTAILPAFNYAVTAIERAVYPLPFMAAAVSMLEGVLRGPVLPVRQAVFGQNVLIASLFVGILALNALADRFWCRYVCPLGALLGWLSKVSLLRLAMRPACIRCARCAGDCRLEAIEASPDYEILPAECTLCLDCLAACPQNAIGFRSLLDPGGWRLDPPRPYDPGRRQALLALAGSAAGVALLRTGPQARQPHPRLTRPPGVEDELTFLAHCLRCSQCMKVCPTSGLQPALLEAGLEGVWTPRLAPRLGYCDYGCNACGQVCPSGAIPALDLAGKRQAVIGVALIDHDLCLPWAHGIPCIVCEEMCPIPNKAVRLEEVSVSDDHGQTVTVQRPHVLHDLCIGCGICEHRCPIQGEAAIKVYRGY